MSKLLGDEAYKAARTKTIEKLNPMKQAFIAVVKEKSRRVTCQDVTQSQKKESMVECRK